MDSCFKTWYGGNRLRILQHRGATHLQSLSRLTLLLRCELLLCSECSLQLRCNGLLLCAAVLQHKHLALYVRGVRMHVGILN